MKSLVNSQATIVQIAISCSMAIALWAACSDDAGVPDLQFSFQEIQLPGQPNAITQGLFVPETSEFLILEKSGKVFHYELQEDGAGLIGSFVISGVNAQSDCGLISLAFDPDFATNHYVYFGYCSSQTHSTISRHVFDLDDYSTIALTATEIITVGDEAAPAPWHNVGSIGFDTHGNMWALFGDKQISGAAQDASNNLGSLVRIIPDRRSEGSGYTPSQTNPFLGHPINSPDILAFGLRSPWRGYYDSKGRYWIGDVGEAVAEEINIVQTENGENLGWPIWEGPCRENCNTFTQPVVHWGRSASDPLALEDPETASTSRRAAWIGIEYQDRGNDRYRGAFNNRLLYGDFCAGWVRAIQLDDNGQVVYDKLAGHLETVTSWFQGSDGYAYVTVYGSCLTLPTQPGKLYRAVPNN